MLLVGCLSGIGYGSAQADDVLSERDVEPVVLTADETPRLLGVAPEEVVAFAWFEGWSKVPTGWFQVPVQVDERKMIDYRPISQSGMDGPGLRGMAYADPHTWAEADGVPQTATDRENPGHGPAIPGTAGDPNLDGNDEIAMMAYEGGLPAGDRPAPEGTDPDSRTPVRFTDPLHPGEHAYIYLFRSNGSLAPDAGEQLVNYRRRFVPRLAGGYRFGYDFEGTSAKAGRGPANREDSTVLSTRYDTRMPGRWMLDHLVIAAARGSDVDLLDGDKLVAGENGCERTEKTFSRGAGGVIADVHGPVRAIRSAIDTGEAPFSQRDYLFYDGMLETRTYLPRVEGPVISAMDLSRAAKGMTYRNSENPDGVRIDGQPDELKPGSFGWEQFAGDQGSITNVTEAIGGAAGASQGSYYEDRAQPPAGSPMLCSGDRHAFGAAGPVFDLSQSAEGEDRFGFIRYSFFDGPEADAELGRLRARQVEEPVRAEVDAPEPAILVVTARPSSVALAPGERRVVRLTVHNHGRRKAARVRVCSGKARSLRIRSRCRKAPRLGRGRAITRRIVIRAGRHAGRGTRRLWIRAAAPGARSYRNAIRVRIRRGA
jgi:hypothetical protein